MSLKRVFLLVILPLAMIVVVTGLPQAHAQATYVVTNANDSGAGSLRWAIEQANTSAGTDTISFNIPGEGVHTISPTSALPAIIEPVIVDGLSQPGAACTSWPPSLMIELDGSSAGVGVYGLGITAGGSTVRGLVINRFSYAGIGLGVNGNNTITCNYLGTDPAGTVGLGNYHGVHIVSSAGNLIGGVTEASGNLISGNGTTSVGSGVDIEGEGATGNQIKGNYIGTDALGTGVLGNANCGVHVQNTSGNIIGGATANERNLISNNNRFGVWLAGSGATGNVVQGNYIGTDVSGTQDLGNTIHGVYVQGAPDNQIGGIGATDGNVISGNGGSGVRIEGSTATGNQVQGNHIGPQVNGTSRLDNGDSGVYIQGAPGNTIGGTSETARNVISGNTFFGVAIYDSGATGNVVLGNYIGTQANGVQPLPNTLSGVYIVNAPNNVVGGTTEGARNLLSGNGFHGMVLYGAGATGNVVQGNHIGTGIGGTENLGNALNGVTLRVDASNNQIGGLLEGALNLITHNGNAGVFVESGNGNLISGNSISLNGGLGIDLAPDGVTANDAGDGDSGANDRQNFPVLTDATIFAGNTVIQGTLDSTASTTFRLEFYYSSTQDLTSYGEGAFFVGAHGVTTDAGGNATFTATLPIIVPRDSYISATATDPNDNTSEFSLNYVGPNLILLVDFQAYAVNQGIMLEWSTSTELENTGFNLYRATALDGFRTKLNETLILAPEPGSALGASYAWLDDQVEPDVIYYYWLEDVDVDEVVTEHGPVSAVALWHRYYVPIVNQGQE